MWVPREGHFSSPFAISQFSPDSLYIAFEIEQFFILITIYPPIPLIRTLVTDWVCPICDAISETCLLSDYKKAFPFSRKQLRLSGFLL